MTFARRTIAADCMFEGLGLHSGAPVRAVVRPGERGIRFRLGSRIIEAVPENVTDTARCTSLGGVATIEHLMSALAGLEVTDAEVEIEGPELPGLDGSSQVYVQEMLRVGLESLGESEIPTLYERLFIQEPRWKIALGSGTGHWRYVFETGPWPGTQAYESPQVHRDYPAELAPARTFVLESELEQVRSMGLGRGLDESSALVIGSHGYLNQERFHDEPARHKLSDAIGDIYLAGAPIRFLNFCGERSGHTGNVRMAALVRQALRR